MKTTSFYSFGIGLFALFLSTQINAQISFTGIVKDSVDNPLEMASVVLIRTEGRAMETYGITGADGKFSLKVAPNTQYEVQISAFGLRTLNDIVDVKESDFEKNYTMSNSIVLDEVVVKLPVTVSGDTIVYNADAFKNGSERKLEDLLENLPGVVINENNQIEVEGKVVNKLLVNGKEFFEGDTKIGTKNIPSNVVDKIQVLRNYSEVGQLNSVRSSQDNFAINIKLKEGKDNFLFGNITGGGGKSPREDLYLAQPKIFYYNPKYSINFIGDLNNIGEIALTRRDIQGFSGRFQQTNNRSGTNIDLGNNNINFNTNQNNALFIENKLASANFSYSPKDNLDVSGFFIYNYSRIEAKENRLFQYTDALLEIPDEFTEARTRELSTQAVVKLGVSYKPNANNQLDYDLFSRFSDDSQRLNTNSSILGNTIERERISPYNINQNLNYYLTINDNNIISLEVQHVLKQEDPVYNAILENGNTSSGIFTNTAQILGFDTNVLQYNVSQDQKIASNQLDAKVDHYLILNNKANLNFTAGTILSRQSYNSDLLQRLDNGAVFTPTPQDEGLTTSNVTDYDFSDFYLGTYLRLRSGKFTFTPGLSLHQYKNSNSQSGNISFDQRFTQLFPDLEVRFQIKKSESLTFNYRVQNQFTDVTRLASSLVMNTYNSFQFGEPSLVNGVSQNLSLLYNSFNLFNNINVFVRAAYATNSDPVRSLTSFDNIIRTSTFFNSPFTDENANAFGRIQKTIGKVRLSANGSLSQSKFNQIIQGSPSLNKSFTRSIIPSISTIFRDAPNFRISYRNSVTDNDQGGRLTKFYRNSIDGSVDAYIKKKFTVSTDYSYTTQRSEINTVDFQTLNTSVKYRKDKDSKWEFELRGTNLLNIDSQVQNTSNNISVFSSETFIQPRFITFRFIYSL